MGELITISLSTQSLILSILRSGFSKRSRTRKFDFLYLFTSMVSLPRQNFFRMNSGSEYSASRVRPTCILCQVNQGMEYDAFAVNSLKYLKFWKYKDDQLRNQWISTISDSRVSQLHTKTVLLFRFLGKKWNFSVYKPS